MLTKIYNKDDIYSGPVPPNPMSVAPDFIVGFIDNLVASAGEKAHVVDQAVLFGGSLLDAAMFRLPKDYDIYVCAPSLAAMALNAENKSDLADMLKPYFSGIQDETIQSPREHGLYGQSFGFNTMIYIPEEGDFAIVDIAIGSKPIDPARLSLGTSAPVLSAVATLYPEAGTYSYHKDFAADVEARVMRTHSPQAPELQEKAMRKRMTIVPFGESGPGGL